MTKTLLALIDLRPSGGEKKMVAVQCGVSDVAWLCNCPVSNTFLMHSDLEERPASPLLAHGKLAELHR